MSFLPWPSQLFSQIDCLNEAQHEYNYSENSVYIIVSLAVLCPFSLLLHHAVPTVIPYGKLQILEVLLMDMYKDMYKFCPWICINGEGFH